MIYLILFLISIIFVAIFAAFEIAYISTERSYMAVELPERIKEFLIGYPERVLTADLIGTNVFSVTAAVSLTDFFMRRMKSGGQAAFLAAAATTLFILLFGEVFPKAYARSRPHVITKRFAPLLFLVYRVSLPVVFLISQISRIISRARENVLTAKEELELLILRGLEERLLNEKEARFLLLSLKLYDKRASDLMQPMKEVFFLPISLPPSKFRAEARKSPSDRIIVYDGSLDNILGVVHIKDLYALGERGTSIEDLLRPVAFVYMNWGLERVFREMKKVRTSFAVVIDEYGGALGVISSKELLYHIIGTMEDRANGNSELILVKGNTRFEELESMGFSEDAPSDWTVSAFILNKIGRIPGKGETIETENLRYMIADADEKEIKKVLIKKKNEKGWG